MMVKMYFSDDIYEKIKDYSKQNKISITDSIKELYGVYPTSYPSTYNTSFDRLAFISFNVVLKHLLGLRDQLQTSEISIIRRKLYTSIITTFIFILEPLLADMLKVEDDVFGSIIKNDAGTN